MDYAFSKFWNIHCLSAVCLQQTQLALLKPLYILVLTNFTVIQFNPPHVFWHRYFDIFFLWWLKWYHARWSKLVQLLHLRYWTETKKTQKASFLSLTCTDIRRVLISCWITNINTCTFSRVDYRVSNIRIASDSGMTRLGNFHGCASSVRYRIRLLRLPLQ